MFCPKCGTQNPDTGRFCRTCGSDLGNVSQALASPAPQQLLDRKGRPVGVERAIVKMFTGFAFIAVALALFFTGAGRGWWFWMLIPAMASIGRGIAQLIALRQNAPPQSTMFTPTGAIAPPPGNSSLPPAQTQWASPESRYKTGDLVPPSVTDATTRHLEMDSEGKTMTLPKQ